VLVWAWEEVQRDGLLWLARLILPLYFGGGVFLDASFSFLAFCVQSGQVTSLAFAD